MKKKMLLYMGMYLLAYIFCFNQAFAVEVTIDLVADTYVDRDFPDTNYGSEDRIDVHYGIDGFVDGHAHYIIRNMILLFSESDLDAIPDGATINSARLKAYLESGDIGSRVYMDVAYIHNSWNESDVTWNNLASGYSYPRSPRITTHVGTTAGWYDWDITRIVRQWHNGVTPNNGVLLTIYLEAGTPIEEYSRIFYSKEGNPARAPQLVVDYSIGPSPESDVDLRITNMEITQAIQILEDPDMPTPGVDNSVVLVEEKPTIVRLYVDNGPTTEPVHGVTAYLYRLNGATVERTFPLNPIVAVESPDRENHHHTINFLLPESWLYDDLELYAEINPPTLSGRVEEIDFDNNRFPETDGTYSTFYFEARDRNVDIAWLKVNYTWSGWTGPALAADRVGRQPAANFIRSIYPVASHNVSYYPWPGGNIEWDENLNSTYYDLRAEMNSVYDLSTITSKPDFLYGWVPEDSLSIKGLSDPPYNGGDGIVAFGEDTDPNFLYRVIFTHELGHNLNQRGHTTLPDYQLSDSEYGYDVLGIDPLDRVVMHHYTDATGRLVELSDYMRGGTSPGAVWDGNCTWTTPYTYEEVHSEMDSRGFYSAGDSYYWIGEYKSILVSGIIKKDKRARLRPSYTLTNYPTKLPHKKGKYCVAFLNQSGRMIQKNYFDMQFNVDNYVGKPLNMGAFSFILPYPKNVGVILLKHGDKVLDKRYVSKNIPLVNVLYPDSPMKLSGKFPLKWQAKDADGDKLTFAVLYSNNNRKTWSALASNLKKTEYLLNTAMLPGGKEVYLRVMATDGVNTALDDCDYPLFVENKKPTIQIQQPNDKAFYRFGDICRLSGYAYDMENGLLSEKQLTWFSDRDGYLGRGKNIATTALSPGAHTISMRGFDNDQQENHDKITIYVAGEKMQKMNIDTK